MPYFDSCKIILIGATTENTTYYLKDALVSRLFILRLNRLSLVATQKLIEKALSQDEVLAKHKFKIDDGLYNAMHNYNEG
ncbi:recombination factor protein RarA, partial [Francisella tularensis subsp. holarctica]|nr:recombination factor protein RarA [Francisella tularensis subsp. holarctica]